MAGKISDYSCNPNYMENAWNSIIEDCGALGNLYVGYMAEKCNENIDFTPSCESRGYLHSSSLKLSFNYIGGIDSVYIIVKVANNVESESFTFKTNEPSELIYVALNVSEDDEVEIIVLDPSNDEELASESHEFTYERDQIWWKTRTVKISYIFDEQKYSINFENW